MSDQPSNQELLTAFQDHAEEDHQVAQAQRAFNGEMSVFKAETEGSLADIHEKLSRIPTREEEAIIVADVIRELLLKKGKFAFHMVVGASVLVGSLVVIGGGFKTVLGWIGFTMMSK